MYSIKIGSPIESAEMLPDLPEGVEIHDEGIRYCEFDDTGFQLAVFTITWAAGIPAGIIANRIYDAMKTRAKKPPTRVIINSTQVEFDREKIVKLIETKVEYRED